MLLLQLSFRKIWNPTAVQKNSCTRAPLGEEVLWFSHQLSEKGTMITSNSQLRKADSTPYPKLPLLQKKVYNAGRNPAVYCRQKLRKIKQLEDHGLFWSRSNVYNNLTPISKSHYSSYSLRSRRSLVTTGTSKIRTLSCLVSSARGSYVKAASADQSDQGTTGTLQNDKHSSFLRYLQLVRQKILPTEK